MKEIFLTLDYELFGNGKGDVFKHIIEPTNKILEIAKQYNAVLTIFFEVVEYWRIKQEWENGNTMGYAQNPTAAMEKQILEAIKQGHDVQLHIHPQWVDAKWTEKGWEVDDSSHRLSHYEREGEYSLENLLRKGKETLEALINPLNPEYRCVALRAGGYNSQPSERIVSAMRNTGLKIDTSIYPGGHMTSVVEEYDYRQVPRDKGFWNVDSKLEVESEQNSDIHELPIMSIFVKRWRKYASMERFKSMLSNTRQTKALYDMKVTRSGDTKKKTLMDKLKFFFEKECQTWDFCLLPPATHKMFHKEMKKQTDRTRFTLVGHPKSFMEGESMKFTLKMLSKNGYRFSTIQSIYQNINKDVAC